MIVLGDQKLVPVSKLKLDKDNPRDIDDAEFSNLVAGIKEFGFVEPVVVRIEDNLVVGGHQRIAALREAIGAKAFKTQSIPVSYVKGLSDKKAKLLNLALNRISGKWNYSKLADVFGSFGEDDDAALSGFSKKELEDVLTMMAEDPLADDGSDPDALLVAHALRMIFDFESEKDANLVKKALKAAGMTGPGDQAKALLAVCAAYPIPKAKR